jgi:hypothetical protein
MAGVIGTSEMEMEMEMETVTGPSLPYPTSSPVVRPIGVSPVNALSEPGNWYRGNRWPPANQPNDRDLLAVPEDLTSLVKQSPADVRSYSSGRLPGRQWTANYYSIAVLAEFVRISVDLNQLAADEAKLFKDITPKNNQPFRWDHIDLESGLPDNKHVTSELEELVTLIDYRPNVLAEALAQREGIDKYFRGILSFSGTSHPWTYGLMEIALHVGEFQVMHYKFLFNRPRASRLIPWLMPPIEVPGHASYPSGHATQSHLVALTLGEVMPVTQGLSNPLRMLAQRIARNREVLGLHYPSDSQAGEKLAKESFLLLRRSPTVKAMTNAARQEWGRPEADNLDATIENMAGLGGH